MNVEYLPFLPDILPLIKQPTHLTFQSLRRVATVDQQAALVYPEWLYTDPFKMIFGQTCKYFQTMLQNNFIVSGWIIGQFKSNLNDFSWHRSGEKPNEWV